MLCHFIHFISFTRKEKVFPETYNKRYRRCLVEGSGLVLFILRVYIMCTCVRWTILTQEQVEQEVVMITASHLLPDLYIACSKFVRACEALLDWSLQHTLKCLFLTYLTYVVKPSKILVARLHSVHTISTCHFWSRHRVYFLFCFPSFSRHGSRRQHHTQRGNMQMLNSSMCQCK